jgi:hypothetical protein
MNASRGGYSPGNIANHYEMRKCDFRKFPNVFFAEAVSRNGINSSFQVFRFAGKRKFAKIKIISAHLE